MNAPSDLDMLRKAVSLASAWAPSPWAAGAEAHAKKLRELKQYLKQREADEWYAAEVERMKERAPA